MDVDEQRDRTWMLEAIRWAREAEARGDVPIGAIVVLDGQVIGRGFNTREHGADPCGHAEIVALREAGARVNRWRIDGATLYVTLEPCAMCAGAIVNSRIARLVYGADDQKAGAVRSLYRLCEDPRLNHRLRVDHGVLASECAALLRDFFLRSRQQKGPRSAQVLRGYEHTDGGRSLRSKKM